MIHPEVSTLFSLLKNDLKIKNSTHALVIGAKSSSELLAYSNLDLWQPFKPEYDALQKLGASLIHEIHDSYPLILIFPNKSKEETFAWFALARKHLKDGGILAVGLSNQAGASRYEKELRAVCGEGVTYSKNKCRAFAFQHHDHWNESAFERWNEYLSPKLIEGTVFQSIAGVFSQNHIDPASALLSAYFPKSFHGKVADLGAGWGFLSHEILCHQHSVSELHLFEADRRALDCAQQNLVQWQEMCHFHWQDVTQGIPTGFDAVVMNPPFHRGQVTDPGLGVEFIHAAAKALKRGGKLYLVANRQLPYEDELTHAGFAWRQIHADSQFKIIFGNRR